MSKVDFASDKRFIGQPLGVATTSFMQGFYSFANYGMSSILVYYLYATIAEGGLGFDKVTAAQLTAVYTAMNTIAGIVGGYVADRFLGVRRAIMIGYLFKTVGYGLLAIPGGGAPLYVANQCLLVLSSCMMGQSLYALVGKMYTATEPRRDGAFTLMYVFNNLFAFSPVITGIFADKKMYHTAFLLPAIACFAAWGLYMLTSKALFGDAGLQPDDPVPEDKRKAAMTKTFGGVLVVAVIILALIITGVLSASAFAQTISTLAIIIPFAYLAYIAGSKKTTPEERKKLPAFVIIFIASCTTLMIWGQAASIMLVFAEERMDNTLFGISFPASSWITIASFYSVIFGSLTGILWGKMGDKQPSTAAKFGVGTLLYGVAALIMIYPVTAYSGDTIVSSYWMLLYFGILIAGECITSPIGFGFATAVAPKAFSTQMVTVWQLGLSTGAGLATLSMNFYTEGQEAPFFLLSGAVTCVVGLLVLIFKKKIMSYCE